MAKLKLNKAEKMVFLASKELHHNSALSGAEQLFNELNDLTDENGLDVYASDSEEVDYDEE